MLEFYSKVNNFKDKLLKPEILEIEKIQPAVLEVNSRTITTDYDRSVIDSVITVHKLTDYRKQFTSMMLMPKQFIELDKLMFSRIELEGKPATL